MKWSICEADKSEENLHRPLMFHLGLQRGRHRPCPYMADILGFAEVNHFLSDVGGVITNAFETLGDDHQIQGSA